MDPDLIANRFLQRLAEDRRQGVRRSLADYRAQFPGHEEVIEAQWSMLHGDGAPPPIAHRETPATIGPFRVLETLGQGGMGTVYLAEQDEPVRRQVALKVVRSGRGTADFLARFELERQALALMNHDSIAKVFDAGTTGDGLPYLAMEYVNGLPSASYCDRHRLTLAERVELFRTVCAGVQHAHQRGVIHRDLKPSNVLVIGDGEDAVPKIIDFGLARATEQQLTEQSFYTEQGMLLGTPEYMSPEQASTDRSRIDTRSDVYSLGVMLYELITGQLPFSTVELRDGGWPEIQRRLAEVEPPKPSKRLGDAPPSDAPERRRTTQQTLVRELRGDLDWVVLKAMAKDPDRRYQSAAGLSDDLERYLNREPVLAGPPSFTYRLRKFVHRNRVQVGAAAAILVALVGGLAASLYFMVDAREAQTQESRLRTRAEWQASVFGSVARLEKARLEAAVLIPGFPNQIPALEAWQREHGAPLRAALAALSGDGPTGDDLATDPFVRDTRDTLLPELRRFVDSDGGTVARIRQSIASARDLERRLGDPGWAEAIAAIGASDRYGGLELTPQVGLVPLGTDPASGLAEFYHVRSAADPAALPARNDDGRFEIDAGTGIIFVLIPGGEFVMGAEDRWTQPPERPPDEVALQPFFLAKYEVTQAQWRRISDGSHTSNFEGDTLPVDQLTWFHAAETLARFRLVLPTEAQWEFACRADTTTPWSSGATRQSLQGHANLADLSARDSGRQWRFEAAVRDGFVATAPVGSFAPNPFGLHDMHGNLNEWCREPMTAYTQPVSGPDAERQPREEDQPFRALRGGAFSLDAIWARSGMRNRMPPDVPYASNGVRPARALE